MNLGKVLRNSAEKTGKWMKIHSPEIFAGLGIGCFVGAIVTAIEATPKAVDIKRKEEQKIPSKDINVPVRLTFKETVPLVWREYMIPASLTVAGTGFICMSVSTSNKRYVALGTSYELLRDAAIKYKDNVIETIGKNQEAKVRAKIAQKDVDDNPPQDTKIILTGGGNTLFKESLTGQYFRGDINKIKNKAVELSNDQLSSPEQYIGVADWLLDLGLDVPNSMLGQGWSITDQGKAVVVYTDEAVVAHNYNGEPCIVIDYSLQPIDDYYIYSH